MAYQSPQEKIRALAHLVSELMNVSLDAIMAPTGRTSKKILRSRTLLLALAHYARINDGVIQDLMDCSKKDIHQAILLVEIDHNFSSIAIGLLEKFAQTSKLVPLKKVSADHVVTKVLTAFDITAEELRYPERARAPRRAVKGRHVVAIMLTDALHTNTEQLNALFATTGNSIGKVIGYARKRMKTDQTFQSKVLGFCAELNLALPTT